MSCPNCGAEETTAGCPNCDAIVKPGYIPTRREYQPPVVIQSGWYCPKCGMVNAPWMEQCPCNVSPMMFYTYIGVDYD